MKHIWVVLAIIGGVNSDNLAHEKEMRQLEIKKLELELKNKATSAKQK
jgi:hypothetical protein